MDKDTIHVVDLTKADVAAYKKVLADAIILTKNMNLYMQNREHQGKAIVNLFGGHVEGGETPLEAVIREVNEETGGLPNVCDTIMMGAVTEDWTQHSELVYIYFWHDRHGTITGCYEHNPIEFASVDDALSCPDLMNYTRWALLKASEMELL